MLHAFYTGSKEREERELGTWNLELPLRKTEILG
jgi:hypothetical protein